ncbi:MAG: PorV/PorQ family protein [Bacteroidota bacterium]
MKKEFKVIIACLFVANLSVTAGNKDRQGQAGAGDLLINPYARTSGMAGANVASVYGIEAQYLNVAGIAQTRKTEVLFTRTAWLRGTDININAFGLTQRVGESGVMGVGFNSMSFGEIPITTTQNPDGGIGTFNPTFTNINLSYAKEFSNSIYGGVNLKAISHRGAADIRASGVAIDAGIQYVTTLGKKNVENKEMFGNNVHFGIAIKNVGAPLQYKGDGLNTKGTLFETERTLTLVQRANAFEMPTLLNIAGAYDLYLLKDKADHKIAFAFNFQANSFSQNQLQGGLEYGFRKMFMIRGGLNYEKNIFNETLSTSVLAGPTAGFTVELPISKSGSTFGLDYGFRATNRFGGCHSIGARINL